jgi:hypothetical protein
MNSLEVYRHTVRLENPLQPVGKLPPETFLHREATREQPHQARELGQPEDVLVGDVADVGRPKNGRAWCSHRLKNGIGPSTIWLIRQSGPRGTPSRRR